MLSKKPETSLRHYAKRTAPLFIFSTLIACGQLNLEDVEREVDPRFQAYVLDFEMRTGIDNKVAITFQQIEQEDVIAICYDYKNLRKNYIIVDPEMFESLSDSEKEETIYHELGHCVMNRKHEETTYKKTEYPQLPVTSLYKSIMYPYVFGRLYSRFKDYYVEELTDPNVSLLKHFQ